MSVLLSAQRKTVRAPTNPLDLSTIVSIYPKKIKEIKPTIQPGIFVIESGSYENPSVLVVGSSSWWKETDPEQPLIEIPNYSIQVADSFVKDFCNGLVACNMNGNSMPGIFHVPGDFKPLEIKTKFKAKLDQAKVNQDNWFRNLVTLADEMWARTNGNPLGISDDMRMAANQLNLKGKDWMQDFTMMEKINCVACGSPRNPLYPVCPTCKAVADPELAKKHGIQFAQ